MAQAIPFNPPTTRTSPLQDNAIPYHTRYYRKSGRPSMKEKAQGQQYLTPDEEKALIAYLLLISKLGQPARIKTSKHIKPPGKN
ncbi:hypothetical protein J3E71DRAFT_281513 [Bipolaris maydis]|nr:hypothetical protein J3E73DRAFT_298120 [Bipolaris maydis]KAJ6283384.1 hypothetical protein J3E71DRAFT_281513 [Bipolaris maydis]